MLLRTLLGLRDDLDLRHRWWHRLFQVVFTIGFAALSLVEVLLVAGSVSIPPTLRNCTTTSLLGFTQQHPANSDTLPHFLELAGELGVVDPSNTIRADVSRQALAGGFCLSRAATRNATVAAKLAAAASRAGEGPECSDAPGQRARVGREVLLPIKGGAIKCLPQRDGAYTADQLTPDTYSVREESADLYTPEPPGAVPDVPGANIRDGFSCALPLNYLDALASRIGVAETGGGWMITASHIVKWQYKPLVYVQEYSLPIAFLLAVGILVVNLYYRGFVYVICGPRHPQQ